MRTALDRPIVAWLFCLALSPLLTAGQDSFQDSFKVAARDRNGKPVPGVTLSVLSGGNKFSAGVTDENGRHDVPIDLGSIPPGQSIQIVVRKCRHMDGSETTEVFFLSPGSRLPLAKNCDDHMAGFFPWPGQSGTAITVNLDNFTVTADGASTQNAAGAVASPAVQTQKPNPTPVAQQTPPEPSSAPGTYTKPPSYPPRTAKCPECQQYADKYNLYAAFLDDDWRKKVRLQKGMDITRQAIADRQKQIAALQQQPGAGSDAAVQQQIADLQKVNEGQEKSLQNDQAALQEYDRRIASDTEKLKAAEAALNACKCPEPTKTTQVPSPPPAPEPPTKPAVTEPKSSPAPVGATLGLTTPTGTLDPHTFTVSLFGFEIDVGLGATWEVRADGAVVFTSSIGPDKFATVFTGNPDGSVTYTTYTNGRVNVMRSEEEEGANPAFILFFGGLPLASKPDTPVATTVAPITTPAGKGFVITGPFGYRTVNITSPDGSHIQLQLFGSDYWLFKNYATVESGTIPPGTDFQNFINSKLDQAQSWSPPKEPPNYDTGHYDNFDPFRKPAPTLPAHDITNDLFPSAPKNKTNEPAPKADDAAKAGKPATTTSSAFDYRRSFALDFHLRYEKPNQVFNFSCPVQVFRKAGTFVTCQNERGPSASTQPRTTFFAYNIAYDPAFYNILLNVATSAPFVFNSACKEQSGGKVSCDINLPKVSSKTAELLTPLVITGLYDGPRLDPSVFNSLGALSKTTETPSGIQVHVDITPATPATPPEQGANAPLVQALTFNGPLAPFVFLPQSGNRLFFYDGKSIYDSNYSISPRPEHAFLLAEDSANFTGYQIALVNFMYSPGFPRIADPHRILMQTSPLTSLVRFDSTIVPSSSDPNNQFEVKLDPADNSSGASPITLVLGKNAYRGDVAGPNSIGFPGVPLGNGTRIRAYTFAPIASPTINANVQPLKPDPVPAASNEPQPTPPAHHVVEDLIPKTEANPRPYLQLGFNEVRVTSVLPSGTSQPPTENVTLDYSKLELNYSAKPVKKGKQPQAVESIVADIAQQSAGDVRGLDASLHRSVPDHRASRDHVNPSLQPAAFHSGYAPQALAPGTLVRLVPRSQSSAQAATPGAAPVSFSFIANGNPSGEALELRVVDPSGKLQEIRAPDGLILEPLERGSVKPVSAAPGERLVSRKLNAYCVKYDEDPPEPDAVYRVAAPQIQEQYKPVRSVIRAGRELAAAGTFHPDSDPADYMISIRQYALWTRLENWNEEKFAEVFREKTRAIAEQSKMQWTKQLDDALRALVPGRWRDISMVLEEARRLEAAEASTSR